MAEVDHLLTKKVADRYLKREVLGEGTYGVVYKAIDTKVGNSNSVEFVHLLVLWLSRLTLLTYMNYLQIGMDS